MKKIITTILGLSVSFILVTSAHARDTKLQLPIDAAMSKPEAKEKLGHSSVKFYFGKQKHPKVTKSLISDVTNKKTNAFGKSDEDACNWAFLSAMLALEQRAQSLGANAVINIVSYYKKNTFSSNTEFECHAGGLMAGVALKGDFVKIGGK